MFRTVGLVLLSLHICWCINIPSVGAPAIDGTRRNLGHDSYGAAHTPLRRVGGEPVYSDGYQEFRRSTVNDNELPSPREISERIFGQNLLEATKSVDNTGRNLLLGYFGQMLDHDITLTKENHDDAKPFSIPDNDRFYDPFNTGNVISEHPFSRSETIEGSGTDSSNPRRFDNFITAWIDASFVYGSSEEEVSRLRDDNGELLHGAKFPGDGVYDEEGYLLPHGLLPMDNPRGSATNDDMMAAGDIRCNENPVLASLHTVFFREHNRKVKEMTEKGECSGSDECFDKARLWVGALVQSIVVSEYLPALFGRDDPLGAYTGYKEDVDPAIAIAFSTATFRFGHSQISGLIPNLGHGGKNLGGLLLRDTYFMPSVVDERGISGILRGVMNAPVEEFDHLAVGDLRNSLFSLHSGGLGQDLISRNINRGRDHGILTYAMAREYFLNEQYTSLDDYMSDEQQYLKDEVRDIYESERDIDLFLGMFLDKKTSNYSVFGDLLEEMVSEQFRRLRDSDFYWYANADNGIFDANERSLIENTKLVDIIIRNTNIRRKEVPQYSFFFGRPVRQPTPNDLPIVICDYGHLDDENNVCRCIDGSDCKCDMTNRNGDCDCGKAHKCQATTSEGRILGGSAQVVLALYGGDSEVHCENAMSCTCSTLSSTNNRGICYKQGAVAFDCLSPTRAQCVRS